jgi:hypothetical protein
MTVRLSQLDIWGRHEQRCLGLLRRGLVLLSQRIVGTTEPELNRELYFCVLEATQEALRAGATFVPTVVPEGRNPPVGSDAEAAPRERKVPDFYWALIDHQVLDPRHAARQYAVECKRLAVPSRTDWVFTEQYVVAGILRFVRPEHAYGKGVSSGVMVGYVQDLSAPDALAQVNSCASSHGVPGLTTLAAPPGGLREFAHDITRGFHAHHFRLLHLWVQL